MPPFEVVHLPVLVVALRARSLHPPRSATELLNNPSGWLFISQGRSTDYMLLGLASAGFAVAAFAAGLPWGALGVAVAYAASEYLKTPVVWAVVCRKGPVRLAHVVQACGPAMLGAHAALLAGFLAHDRLAAHGLPGLAAALLLAYATFAATLLPFAPGRALLRDAKELAEGRVRRLRRAA